MNHYLDDVFGAGGYLARNNPAYEVRAGQVRLAHAVDAALGDGATLLAEGPCGTGKSLAYLVPALYRAAHDQRRVLIATASNALSEQLVSKDLPFLEKVLPWRFRYAMLKGRGNYACRVAADTSDGRGLFGPEIAAYDELRAWTLRTRTGDTGELTKTPAPRVLERFTVQSDECLHTDCPAFDRCFYETAKQRAFEADVLVTNYHLLFAAIEVARLSGAAKILPAFDLVILDEAHEAADVAREFFGFTLTVRAFSRLARLLHAQDWRHGPALVEAGRSFLEDARRQCGPGRHRGGLELGSEAVGELLEAAASFVATKLAALDGEAGRTGPGEDAEHKRRRRRLDEALRGIRSVQGRVEEWEGATDVDRVYLLEATDTGTVALRAKCIDPGPVLRRHLFEEARAVVACSATLTVGGTFAFARRELGAPEEARECEVESPFDFPLQARLIVPRGMPDPRTPTFTAAAVEALGQVIEACEGRTLGLFTSYKALGEAHAHLSRRLGSRFRILRQGDLPRAELIRLFREDVSSVLLATQSFWTGIDVPGEALTGLVIDKLPFPPPNDPVALALAEKVPDAFAAYTVPRAAILLKQGVGRLIRTQADRGVVVLLDPRLVTKGYGRQMLRTLPPMPLTDDLSSIRAFLAQHGRAA